MRIDRIGFHERAVVVLGAGATRGASFVEGRSGVLPPLDSDFFTQAQRLGKRKAKDILEGLLADVFRIAGPNFRMTMEGYLTRLEQLARVHDDYRLVGRPGRNAYRVMRERFLQVLAAVLDEAIGRNPECEYHKTLVRHLETDDVILSLNYDWLIDETLRIHGGGKWNPRFGYGVSAYFQGKKGAGTRYWACRDNSGQPQYPDKSIRVLKLHGSLTWFPVPSSDGVPRLRLRERWWRQHGRPRFEIAPPEWNKPTRSGVYVPVWRAARTALRNTKAVLFIGYSLPETDLPFHALLQVDDKAPKLKWLVTVNPDRKARNRIRQTLRHRVAKDTRVLSFDTLGEFAKFISDSIE